MSETFTYAQIAEHNQKDDVYMVVHDKVYNASKFVDEHPGGEEVMMDVAGQDATEAFEDVGHSDEAREILKGLLVGDLKRVEGDPVPKAAASSSGSTTASGGGLSSNLVFLIVVLGVILGYAGYTFMKS